MADDIQIKPTTGTQNGSTVATAGAQTAVTNDNSVIDLRSLDQKPVAAPAAPVAAVAAKKSNAVSLDEEDQTTTIPPEKYSVPASVTEKFPDLIQLIKETESMNDSERDYWFQILPIMTEDQIKKFRDILLNEKTQLQKLDKEYDQEMKKLNEKHLIEWKEFETKEKRKALTTAESASKTEEKAQEEDLLKRLSQV